MPCLRQVTGPAPVVNGAVVRHHGHRTALSQRTLQAHADRFLGWTELDVRGEGPVGFVVSEYSPYEQDLAWDDITEPTDVAAVVEQLGRATAKIHCVSDVDSDSEIVDFSLEHAVRPRIAGLRGFAATSPASRPALGADPCPGVLTLAPTPPRWSPV